MPHHIHFNGVIYAVVDPSNFELAILI